MKLFAGLRKIREFEKIQLPFVKSIFDLDIVIEIGYAEEMGKPLTLKQLFLLNITSKSSVRRKLRRLIDAGMIMQRPGVNDRRTSVLVVSSSSLKILNKYAHHITGVSTLHFRKPPRSEQN